MRYHACFLIVLSLSLTPAAMLLAEQQVTLKSGASLIGKVTIEGTEAVVEIDGSTMRVPLEEVDTIGSVDSGHDRQARRLLLTALEAKLSKDQGTEVIGLLAEAARLSPDDPHVAYWYASCLADAGFGKAASDVLERRRELIAKAYPGMTEQLAARIKKRVQMENMPPVLVDRLDRLNAAAANQPENVEMRHYSAVFRLVDQHERGIDRSAFHAQCNGQDENLEVFDDGYFLFAYNQHRNSDNQSCRIEVVQPGLESKTFELSAATNRVHDAGTLVVQRYDEKAKTPFRARLVGPDGKPIVAAQVKLQPQSQRGGTVHVLSAESDSDGRVEILAFPLQYTYNVQAEDYNFQSGNVELKADAGEASEKEIVLHPAIQATIRVAWTSTSLQGGGKTSGESTLQVDGGPPAPYRYGPGQDTTSWIRPIQIKDRLTLHLIDNPFGFGGPFAAADPWVRVVESDEGADRDGAAKAFESINLDKIDDLTDTLRPPRTTLSNEPGFQRPPTVVSPELGKIYVGKLQGRDMRTGQPMQIAYKAMVEEMLSENPTPK